MSYPTRPYKIACSKNTAGLGLSAHQVHINSLTSPHMTPAKLSVTSHTHSAGSLRGSRVTPKYLCWPPLPCAHCPPNPPTHLQSQCHGAPASTISALTLLPHARLLALAQPALLTLATHVHVHFTLATVLADVLCTLDDTASEEALAAFTAQHVVVEARGLVPTHAAHFVSQHLRGRALLPLQGGIFYRNEQYQGKGRWGGGRNKQKRKPTHMREAWCLQLTAPFLTATHLHSNPLSPKHMDEKIKYSISQAPLLGKHIFANQLLT